MEEGREGNRKRRAEEEEEGRDYISSLPPHLLLHILSFLPLEDVFRVVSFRKFFPLWTSLHSFIFSQCNFHRCHNQGSNPEFELQFLNFVDRVLSTHELPEVDKFALSMHIPFPPQDLTSRFGDDADDDDDVWTYPVASRHKAMWKRVLNTVDSCVRFSLHKKAKILFLDFMACGSPALNVSDCYLLPSDVLQSTHLVELYLDNCRLDLFRGIHLASLSKLSLLRINLSEEKMAQIMAGCVALKELSLVECTGLKKLSLLGRFPLETLSISLRCLEYLHVSTRRLKSLRVRVFLLGQIRCPQVTSLDLFGALANLRYSTLCSFGEASLCLGLHFRPCKAAYRGISSLLGDVCCLFKVGHFNSCPWFIMLTKWERPDLLNFKWRSVTALAPSGLSKWVIPGICNLIKHSDLLETLVIYVYPSSCHARLAFPVGRWLEAHDFDVAKYLNSVRSPFRQLKKVKFCGIVTEPYAMKLIEFLLGNTTTLEEMVISLRETPPGHKDECAFRYEDGELPVMTPEMVEECSHKVFGFSRLSVGAAIHFI